MVTELGKFLRKLRIDRNEYLKDMAGKLNVTVSYLSAIENGNKKMPPAWGNLICELYNLDAEQSEEFTKAIADSEDKVEMNLKGMNKENRYLAVSFARKFSDFDERKKELLFKLLEEDEE